MAGRWRVFGFAELSTRPAAVRSAGKFGCAPLAPSAARGHGLLHFERALGASVSVVMSWIGGTE